MDVSLLIFDCDGVLIDSEVVVARVYARLLTELGYAIGTEDIVRRFTGVSDAEMYATIEGELGRNLPASLPQLASEAVAEAFRAELKPIAGIHDAVRATTLPICVASNSTLGHVQFGLELIGLYEAFAPNVFSASQVRSGKPAPDLFLHVADCMGVPPGQCLVIEDSIAGVTAAGAAGMPVLGFVGATHCPPGHGNRLCDAGAILAFGEMRQLPGLVSWLGSVPDGCTAQPPAH